ncbi:MAG TPA: hypothetical protein VNY73_01545 [Bacteroidia bacterium]|nr:hypothetical protein [Bacteroidia bacterium]
MKARTLIELLTLSTNIYMISKDEKLMNNLTEMKKKGRETLEGWIDDLRNSDEDEGKLTEKLIHKTIQVKHELEETMEDVARKVYEKMNIAHTDYIKNLEQKVEQFKKELELAEARITTIETPKK